MTAFALAIQFLTIISIPERLVPFRARATDFGPALIFFPAVGAILGGIVALIDGLIRPLIGSQTASAVVLLVIVVLTGAMHLDGFLDTCDGLFLFDKTKRLDAMRDSRVGGFAVAGGLAVYAVKLSALTAIVPANRAVALLFVPVLGRFAMALVVHSFPYARTSGAGNVFKVSARTWHLILAGLLTFGFGAWLSPAVFGVAMMGSVVAWLLGAWISRRLRGLTGDTYGFICEIIETFAYVVLSAAVIR